MSRLDAFKERVQELIGRNRPEKAFELLKDSLKPETRPADDVRMQESRYNRIRREREVLGTIDHQTASAEYQSINKALLTILEGLEADELVPGFSAAGGRDEGLSLMERRILEAQGLLLKKTDNHQLADLFSLEGYREQEPRLGELLSQMDFDEEVGLWHRVNCDRIKTVQAFWDSFDRLENLPYQFYFVSACPTQMPPSFAERMVYELIREELDEEDNALFFLRKETNARVRILDLPLKRKLSRSQKKFKADFCELFEFKEGETFEHFIETGIPNLKYEYAVLLFEIHERNCKDHFIEFLEWLIQTFTTPHEEVPHFLFFIVVYVDGLHTPKAAGGTKKELIDGLEALAVQYESATHFQPLKPVARQDLIAWILDMGERNQAKVDDLILEFVRSLSDSADRNQYEQESTFNMDDVERLQDLICNYIEKVSS